MTYGPYRVAVWREPDGAWSAAASDVDGALTAGGSLGEVERNIREAIGLVLDLPRRAEREMTVELEISVDGGRIDELVAAARRAREAAALAASATEEAVRELRAKGMSTRDVARLVGVTAGRVSQLGRPAA